MQPWEGMAFAGHLSHRALLAACSPPPKKHTVICRSRCLCFLGLFLLVPSSASAYFTPHPWPAQFPPPPPGSAAPLSGTGQVWSQGQSGTGWTWEEAGMTPQKGPIKCPVLYSPVFPLPPNPSSPGIPPPPVLLPLYRLCGRAQGSQHLGTGRGDHTCIHITPRAQVTQDPCSDGFHQQLLRCLQLQ